MPAEPWEGILDATNDSLLCPQPTEGEPWKSLVTEDCLTLDIYTPKVSFSVAPLEAHQSHFSTLIDSVTFLEQLSANRSDELLPVLVYIHFGGFVFGGTREEPQRYMNKDIVLVIINYRLGPFGKHG